MKKVALVFVLAVLLPSLVLAWLAVRSLRDQQFLLEHQQALLDQRATDSLAQNISDYLAQQQQEFSARVETLAAGKDAQEVAGQFDGEIRQSWPLAEVGFCVTLSGKILSPSQSARAASQTFYENNSDFLGNRESAEVYGLNGNANAAQNVFQSSLRGGTSQLLAFSSFSGTAAQNQSPPASTAAPAAFALQKEKSLLGEAKAADTVAPPEETSQRDLSQTATVSGIINEQQVQLDKPQTRKVSPQNVAYDQLKDSSGAMEQNLSKVIPAEAEFAQLVGSGTDGMLARFLQNKLELLFWHRLSTEPDLVFGAELNLNRVVAGLRGLVQPDPALQNEICLAILDDNARPVALSRAGFQANWKHPFVATEIGDALPHWEAAAYLVNPAQLTQAARTAELTLGLLIGVLVLAIGVGSWLIVTSLNAELKLARQKTDFVSNVSHELKTPLTSIRMFSELLAENRVADHAKQRSYLQIITAEAARLTRLINNVLDFSRMERGEKKYNFQPCDLTEIVRATVETFRPHLEANGFKLDSELPETKIPVRGDNDALSQVIVNLLSNAEKYSNGGKEITLQLAQKQSPLPHVEVKIMDRGSGVPRGSEEKIFEKFYRAHDSLSSGIQGSGLGLTIARQIARAHGGDVVYERREGGGSCFILRLPLSGGTA
ncbi:MAG TPA: HAMP domain-containing sensor histidine kinase [Candidatus Aquilonibacter sp.]|nr:HAMP domain-containing sensor histidine kinase [Candidatus Aquilonibacter sp.]